MIVYLCLQCVKFHLYADVVFLLQILEQHFSVRRRFENDFRNLLVN